MQRLYRWRGGRGYLDVLIQVKLTGDEEGHIFNETALVDVKQKPTLFSILEGRRVESKANSNVHHPPDYTWMYFEPNSIV